jgi:hypothetical protein
MKHFICVTSVINISNKPLSYTYTRSVFSHAQRLEQTCKTLTSICDHFTSSTQCEVFILVVDASPEPLTEIQQIRLKEHGASDVLCIRHEDCEGPLKGLGETRIMQASLQYMKEKQINADWWWKIGGRAWLTKEFDVNSWISQSTLREKGKARYPHPQIMSTICFNVPSCRFQEYEELLEISVHVLRQNQGIEKVLGTTEFFDSIEGIIGVNCYCAVDGNYICN